MHGLPFLELPDHDDRDTTNVVWVFDKPGHRELGRLPVMANHRNCHRLSLVILDEGPIAPFSTARYLADPVSFHVPQPSALEASTAPNPGHMQKAHLGDLEGLEASGSERQESR